MKIESKIRDVATGGVSEKLYFRMEMNAMAFHSVIDGIYADKIAAPLRELCTNARDGHSANGNLSEPFDVHLPSLINPIFKVRDYGIGLSHDDIMGMYTTMFASSKRDSNDAVGMIGLGSKSPFAYTSAFTVTSWFDGVQSIYSAFIGETGVPEIALLDECSSNQRGGMEVQFPVSAEDVPKFRDAAQRVLFGFDPYPNVLNETFVRTEAVVQYEGPNWKMYADGTVPFASLMARQGCVLYPIDPKPLGVNLEPIRNTYAKVRNNGNTIYQWPVVIDFPIGALDVATSREALGYTAKTIANLKAGIDATMALMTKIIDAEIEAAPTFIDACVIAAKARSNPQDVSKRNLFNMLFSHLRYKGKPLMERVSVPQDNPTCPFNWYSPQFVPQTFWGKFQPNIGFRPRKFNTFSHGMEVFANTYIYMEMPDLKNGPARMRRVIQAIPENNREKHVLWMRPINEAERDAMLVKLGNPAWIDLATIEPEVVPKASDKKNLLRFRYHLTTNQYSYGSQAMYDFVIPTTDMYYIKQTSGQFFIGAPSDPPLTITGVLEQLRSATSVGLLPAGMKVYFLNSANIKVLEDVKMKPIGDLIFENVKKLDFASILDNSEVNARNSRKTHAERVIAAGVKLPADLEAFVKEAILQTPAVRIPNASGLTKVIQDFCPAELDVAARRVDPLKQRWHDLQLKYPLITVTSSTPAQLSHYLELISK